jgi:polar amino acid transport system substrate-binding protein
VQALPWEELAQAIRTGDGEAIIAGLAVNGDTRGEYRFTRSFLQLPARFVERMPDDTAAGEAGSGRDAAESTAGLRVGVVRGTAHEAMLRAYFPQARTVAYTRASFVQRALKSGNVSAAFGDGVQLSFWLGSEDAEGCCRFLDGPFFSETFLGHGLAIAVLPENGRLADAFDYALLALNKNGRFADIYLRYFPNGLY